MQKGFYYYVAQVCIHKFSSLSGKSETLNVILSLLLLYLNIHFVSCLGKRVRLVNKYACLWTLQHLKICVWLKVVSKYKNVSDVFDSDITLEIQFLLALTYERWSDHWLIM